MSAKRVNQATDRTFYNAVILDGVIQGALKHDRPYEVTQGKKIIIKRPAHRCPMKERWKIMIRVP